MNTTCIHTHDSSDVVVGSGGVSCAVAERGAAACCCCCWDDDDDDDGDFAAEAQKPVLFGLCVATKTTL